MSLLPANATHDELAEELDFTEVLIASLDAGADEYSARLEELENTKATLEQRLQAAPSNGTQFATGMDGASDWWQTTLNGRPMSNDGFGAHQSRSFDMPSNNINNMKRNLPRDLVVDTDQHRSKRPTPDPSNSGTPTSSLDSYEYVANPNTDLTDRVRQRQLAAEAAARRQREQAKADELFARNLSQQPDRPSSAFNSSTRPTVQTTIGHTGSFIRPPPQIKPEASQAASPRMPAGPSRVPPVYTMTHQSPYVKLDPMSARQPLAQRPRQPSGFVDLTGSDSEDDEVSIIGSNGVTPSRSAPNSISHSSRTPIPCQPMPGTYPTPYTYPQPPMYGGGSLNAADQSVRDRYNMIKHAQVASQNAIAGVKYAASSVSGQLRELNGLINGSSSNPYRVGDDDDLVYGGYRQRPLGIDPLNPYAGYDELYSCLLYTSPSPRDGLLSRMPSSA